MRIFVLPRMKPLSRPSLLVAAITLALAVCPSARAWGCEGHEIVAYIAEAHLTPHARAAALKILKASPIDPGLSRYCQPRSTDPFADASTWADDIRSIRPDTRPWHFIDIPRAARRGSLAPYCPPATGCVVSALETQLRILKNPRASPAARADALRFIIHFVGDIHQPLHDATNNDEGGNCVPVEFFSESPRETNAERESFDPNLHWVWDVGIIDKFALPRSARSTDSRDRARMFAREFDGKFQPQIRAWEQQPVNFTAWAWESHALADSVAYGKLPRAIPIDRGPQRPVFGRGGIGRGPRRPVFGRSGGAETPRPINSCADNNHVALRMLRLNENLSEAYESAAAPVVQQQLAKVGARLALVLNSALH